MLKRLKPLQIYLIGGCFGLLSGLFIRPVSETAHAIVVVVALLICMYGIVRHFRGR